MRKLLLIVALFTSVSVNAQTITEIDTKFDIGGNEFFMIEEMENWEEYGKIVSSKFVKYSKSESILFCVYEQSKVTVFMRDDELVRFIDDNDEKTMIIEYKQ
jgi:hypothetical protein